MSNNYFYPRKSCRLWDNVEKKMVQSDRSRMTNNTVNAHCMLNIQGYGQTLRIKNKYCFSIATMVTRTRLSVTCIRTYTVPYYDLSQRHKTLPKQQKERPPRLTRPVPLPTPAYFQIFPSSLLSIAFARTWSHTKQVTSGYINKHPIKTGTIWD